jgi:hypothetical protein
MRWHRGDVVPAHGENERAEEHGRRRVEDEGENDRQPVAGLHEAEERRVLAYEQARKRSDGDPDRAQGGQDEDQVADVPP